MKKIFIILFASGYVMSANAQKIKTDKIDKETKTRIVETNTIKVSSTDIIISPTDGVFGESRSLQTGVVAFGKEKYLLLSWVNTKELSIHDIDSVFAFSGSEKLILTPESFSLLGKKKNMIAEGNITLFSNELFLQGDLQKTISKIIIVGKDKSHQEILLENDQSLFVKRANLLVGNSIGKL